MKVKLLCRLWWEVAGSRTRSVATSSHGMDRWRATGIALVARVLRRSVLWRRRCNDWCVAGWSVIQANVSSCRLLVGMGNSAVSTVGTVSTAMAMSIAVTFAVTATMMAIRMGKVDELGTRALQTPVGDAAAQGIDRDDDEKDESGGGNHCWGDDVEGVELIADDAKNKEDNG